MTRKRKESIVRKIIAWRVIRKCGHVQVIHHCRRREAEYLTKTPCDSCSLDIESNEGAE